MYEELSGATFDFHRANPDVTPDAHIRTRHIELGESVMSKERIYLDLKYWILLRKVVTGQTTDPAATNLLAGLRRKVASRISICPISDSIFWELLKQSDLNTRTQTAELIDELSEGITLIHHEQRVATELRHFFRSYQGKELHPLQNLVWSKLSHVMGVRIPTETVFGETEERVIQKAFFDHMWFLPLTKMLSHLEDVSQPTDDFANLAEQLNKAKGEDAHASTSFKQVHRIEVRDRLYVYAPMAQRLVEQMFQQDTQDSLPLTEDQRQESGKQIYTLLYNAILKKKEVTFALRTMHIETLCYAAVRWDKHRRLTGNDIYDFQHAAAAIAYCDVFLTESSLKTLLQQQHLNLAESFPCRVISSIQEAEAWANAS